MSKFSVILLIISLILSTALIKNSTKRLDDEIFVLKENIRDLKKDFGNIMLENDYLSSTEKLLEFQFLYFEDELIQKKLKDIKIYNTSKDIKKIENLKIIRE